MSSSLTTESSVLTKVLSRLPSWLVGTETKSAFTVWRAFFDLEHIITDSNFNMLLFLFRKDTWSQIFLNLVKNSSWYINKVRNRQFVRVFTRIMSFLFNTLHVMYKRSYSLFNWLLLPQLWLKVTVRHITALFLLWSGHLVLRALVMKPCSHILMKLSSFIRRDEFRVLNTLNTNMSHAQTYADWRHYASSIDTLAGRAEWRHDCRSEFYDWQRLRHEVRLLKELLSKQDLLGLIRHTRSALSRHAMSITDPKLYGVCLDGSTKELIEEYIQLVVCALTTITELPSDDISAAEKLAFLNETRHAYGRSALMLSGGATLSLYHTGVLYTLHREGLLPRVISGSSAGAILSAIVCTRTDTELDTLFSDPDGIKLNFFPTNKGSWRRKLRRLVTTGKLLDITILEKCVRDNLPDMTFQDAYYHTGRILNITVSPARGAGNAHGAPRLMNYLTAPNVLVWSAALASCAIPLVYTPVELLCRGEDGAVRPYLQSGVKWEDGSVTTDLPMERLAELFNVNHYIVSQTNPHVVPFMHGTGILTGFLARKLLNLILNLSHVIPVPRLLTSLAAQRYTGDVTIAPKNLGLADYALLLRNPTHERLLKCQQTSSVATYPALTRIRVACQVEFALDSCVRSMRGVLALRSVSSRARLSASMQRVRSFQCDTSLMTSHLVYDEDAPDDDDNEEDNTNNSSLMEVKAPDQDKAKSSPLLAAAHHAPPLSPSKIPNDVAEFLQQGLPRTISELELTTDLMAAP